MRTDEVSLVGNVEVNDLLGFIQGLAAIDYTNEPNADGIQLLGRAS